MHLHIAGIEGQVINVWLGETRSWWATPDAGSPVLEAMVLSGCAVRLERQLATLAAGLA